MRPATAGSESDQCGLVCDLAVRGVRHSQTEALFDSAFEKW